MGNIKFPDADLSGGGKYELHRVERGGEVTHHLPGQVVVYPILNLNNHKKDLHWYLRQIEEVVIVVLRHYGLQGSRVDGK
jgi:lipoyl(octanoyl) transferase